MLCLAEQVRFCNDMEQCLGSDTAAKLLAYKQRLSDQLEEFSKTLVDERVLQLKLKSLILDLVHHIDIVNQMISAKNNRFQICFIVLLY